MTKRDYIAVSQAIRATKDDTDSYESLDCLEVLAGRIADYAADDNPSFDRERFLAACGV